MILHNFNCILCVTCFLLWYPFLSLQVDIDEAKTKENLKLQSDLLEMQLKFQETKELLITEREAAKNATEQTPVIQTVPVIDHEMINSLTAENEKLKVGSFGV